MVQISRAEVLAVMRRAGHHDQIDRARAVLPEQVDTDRDAALLEGLGLTRGGLMEDLGDSP